MSDLITSFVPLIGYRQAEPHEPDQYSRDEERKYETRVRHWAMVWFVDSRGKRNTAEFMVITEAMPDFCGGLMVYSPRIDINTEGNSWHPKFCNPGSVSSEISTDWADFNPETMAVDMAKLTGQEVWTSTEIEAFGMQSIAAKIVGEMFANGRMGLTGADWHGGRMTRLWEYMGANRVTACPSYPFQCNEPLCDDLTKMRPINAGLGYCTVADVRTHYAPEWYNTNSGNTVHWLSAHIDNEEGEDCDYCDCEECCGDRRINFDEKGVELSEQARKVLGSTAYRARARRYFWRNG